MKWGGIIGSAIMGTISGAGQGMAMAGKMELDAELEQRKAEYATKREEMLARLRHDLDQPNKERTLAVAERGVAVNESQAAESARHNAAAEANAAKGLEQQAGYQAGVLSEHRLDRASRERIAKQQAKNIIALEDGTLATYNGETNTLDPLRDPITGERLKGPKDLSLSDKTKVAFLSAQMVELQKERAKALDDTQRGSLDRDIDEYRKQLYGILGMDLGAMGTRKRGGERKPLSAFGG